MQHRLPYYRLMPVFCWLLLLWNGQTVWAQTTKFYSTEQGLSNSLINQVYQDKKGFLWIATENGLNKFDGTRFTVYKKNPDDSTSLKSNHVKTLFEDSSGNFWMRCSGALMKYDRHRDAFQNVIIYSADGSRFYPPVVSICERKNGDVWFATAGYGLFSLKKGETQCKPESVLNDHLNNSLLTVVYEDSQNRLWIGTENNGANVYSFDKLELYSYTTASPEGHRISDNMISAICEGENGDVFVGTIGGGLNRLDATTLKMTPIPDSDGKQNIPVKTLIFDRSNQLLVGTDGFGMKKYNPQKQIIEAYEPFFTSFNFSTSKIHSLIQDKDGNIWVGIYQKGLFFIPANPNGFKYYGYKSFRKNNIGSNCIMAVYKDKNDIIWVGTDNDGLYAINEQTQQVKHYQHTDAKTSVPNTILCIHDTGDGRLWLGSYLDGMASFDKQTGKCSYLNNQTHAEFTSNKVYCIIDDKKGGLWIGTYGGGLYNYNIATQSITAHYYQQNENADGLVGNWINSLTYDDSGLLWIGTLGGLSCLNTRTETFRNYQKENSPMPSNATFALQSDRYGNIWISTDEGLACLNKKTEEIRLFTVRNGLANNEICAIEKDRDGNIWASTFSGISKYSPIEDKFTNFYASDGLQGNEFSYRASSQSKDGEIFFGGINGITGFFPDEIHSKKKDLNVYVTNFYLFGKIVHRYQKSGGKVIFDAPVLELSSIHLAASDNVFGFEFSTLEYTNFEGISYQYRLENFDTGWATTSPGTNGVTYANLPPGKYRFLYQAIDKENKSEIHSIAIIIRPPWYGTTIVKIIAGLLFLFIVYSIYAYLSSRIKQRNEMMRLEHAEQISEAKLQFFTNISHEIRTPMTLIMGPLEKLLMNNRDEKLQNSYLLIYRNAQRILRLINQLMDIRKIDRGQMQLKARETDMVGFIRDIMQSFAYMAQKKNIRFAFHTSYTELKVWVDLNNFDKVLFNVLSNAFKFTPEQGEITIELLTGTDNSAAVPLKNYFEIRVLDTGIGIDKEQIDRIFERFYQIESDVTQSHYGTGIGLHLARSLIELQQGIIYAENRNNCSGSCFVIRMPLGNHHLTENEMEIISDEAPLATFAYSRKDNLFEMDESEAEEPDAVYARTKYHVLIVEDDIEISNYIRMELLPFYKIHQINNGKDALEFILQEKPDLVISDVRMPKMDGITLCRKIKSNVQIDHIPVLLLTAKSSDEDRMEGLDTGADAYMVKPYNPEILKKTIAGLIGNRERLKHKLQPYTDKNINNIEIKAYDEALMDRILKMVNDNIQNPDLNVEMLSAGVGISRVHLHRKLKELTNLSARDFIRTIRLKKAGELLANKKLAISQVYEAVGFNNFSHFSISFKEFYGMSPTEYMNKFAESKKAGKM
ncbi:MAG: response regulator [Dysgonamonadaceae bacterium]|jgi:signal transduction histidine kinase/ligand-binding sensor domain-containing protein/DNA-binding response OmpR family regulator|nr:response regulator [Dysgonamonadaceae bacterium]